MKSQLSGIVAGTATGTKSSSSTETSDKLGSYVTASSRHPGETGLTGCTGPPGDPATSAAPAKPINAGTPTPRQHDHNEPQLP